jgi:exonuclease III
LRIVSLNIHQGGGKRIAQLAQWLLSKRPSVVFLQEWRNDNAGRQLTEKLKEDGLKIDSPREKSKRNSVLVTAVGIANSQNVTPLNSAAGDLVLIEITNGIRILECYFPQSHAKAPFFHQCIQTASENRDVPLVIIGDFNTG